MAFNALPWLAPANWAGANNFSGVAVAAGTLRVGDSLDTGPTGEREENSFAIV